MRYPKLLRPVKNSRNFNYATFDIEASEWVNFELLGFYDGEQYYQFNTVEEFLVFFLSRKYVGWRCFAHNGGKYDFNFIVEGLMDHFPEYKIIMLDMGGIGKLVVKDLKGKRYWVFLDSLKLLPMSLKKLTESFNVEHKKLDDIDFQTLFKNRALLEEYLMYDVIGLYEVIQKASEWFSEYQMPLKPTLASQSMAMWRQTIKTPIWTLSDDAEKFARDSYFGGRVEIFKMKADKPIYTYDVNSLYPSVMINQRMPTGKAIKVFGFKDDEIGFYKATVHVPETYLPVLPKRVGSGKIIFPTGKIDGVFSGEELRAAINMGADYSIDHGYVFGNEVIFKEYIERLYDLKLNAKDKVTYLLAKLLMNSLYGKFGQNRNKNLLLTLKETEEMEGLKPYNMELGIFSKDSVSNANFIIPSISSHITSLARMSLFNYLKKAGHKNIYYCDTDSVMTTRPLDTSDKLGDMKMEKHGKEAIFLLPKLYAIRDYDNDEVLIKAKGFERDFVKGLSFLSFEKALDGDYSDFRQAMKKFASFKVSMKRNGVPVSMIDIKKSIRSKYDKRKVVENWDTMPLHI